MAIFAYLPGLIAWICFATSKVYPSLMHKNVRDELTNRIFNERCYGELGCFSNGPPFFNIVKRPISLHPDKRESINTRFLLYTRQNPHESLNFTNLHRKDYQREFIKSTFRANSRIKFIVSGFLTSLAPDWMKPLKDQLLETEDLKIFIVDWTDGDGPFYEQAVANTRIVGAEIALFIEYLERTVGSKPENVHIIGYSLGSHIAGYAGKRTESLGRITGLDPAGPYFINVDPVVRLAAADALLVDVIHTNGAHSRFKGFGTTESIGDIDFFPNGGRFQPGCPDIGTAVWDFLKYPSLHGPGIVGIKCHHHRAIELFAASINASCRMIGAVCDTWEDFLKGKCKTCDGHAVCPIMGYEGFRTWKPNINGPTNVYLNTTAVTPFCENHI